MKPAQGHHLITLPALHDEQVCEVVREAALDVGQLRDVAGRGIRAEEAPQRERCCLQWARYRRYDCSCNSLVIRMAELQMLSVLPGSGGFAAIRTTSWPA